MSRVLSQVNTNTPFSINNPQMLFMIPKDVVINLFVSVDGNTYEDVSGRLYGEQLVSVTFIPCNTFFKIISDDDVKINILK